MGTKDHSNKKLGLKRVILIWNLGRIVVTKDHSNKKLGLKRILSMVERLQYHH